MGFRVSQLQVYHSTVFSQEFGSSMLVSDKVIRFFISPLLSLLSQWHLSGMLVYLLTISRSQNKYSLLENDEEKLLEDTTDKDFALESLSLIKRYSMQIANALVMILIFSTIWPFPLSAGFMRLSEAYHLAYHYHFFRPFITLSTGILMLVSDKNRFLSNPTLTYIGDISYSLYLIHWPIYAYWKLSADGNQYGKNLLSLIITCYQ